MHTIIEVIAFDKPIQEVRLALDVWDSGCPNQHYTKVVDDVTIELQGHPLACFNDGGCHGKMHTAATHFPVLRTLVRLVYSAVNRILTRPSLLLTSLH